MIELVLRTTESSGLVKEQILARLDGGQALPDADPILEYSGLCIDSLRHQASYQGQEISLTENYEFHTLAYLASQPGRVYTKEQIYQAVWKEEPVDVSQRGVLCHREYPPRSCGRLQRKNISRPCGESDTNLWMSQGSEPLGLFSMKVCSYSKLSACTLGEWLRHPFRDDAKLKYKIIAEQYIVFDKRIKTIYRTLANLILQISKESK